MTRATPIKPCEAMLSPTHDPVAPWCADVLTLFAGALGDVQFPDVDGPTLEGAAQTVRGAQLETESLERALDEARARTHTANAEFAELCGRALAYARVFASTQPELEAALATVRTRSDKPLAELAQKKRGRPRKDRATVELLPDDAIAAQ